jgi:L-ascorbate metabolism protein UlaG (beta-lactamase superfamily)
MTERVQITYFDTAMALIEVDGVRFLTDPVLDPKGTVFEYGPVRLSKTNPPPVAPQDLGRIDAVLLSHDQHGDNLDNAGRAFLSTVPLVLTTPSGAERLGPPAVGLGEWDQRAVSGADGRGVTVTAMPALHSPEGTQEASGPVTGFLLTTGAGSKVYISGDTIPFTGTEEIARRYAPVDLAILHMGRAQIEAMGNLGVSLSADDAVRYAEALQAKRVLPIHFEGWAHFTEGREAARRTFDASGLADRAIWLERGETAVVELGRTAR